MGKGESMIESEVNDYQEGDEEFVRHEDVKEKCVICSKPATWKGSLCHDCYFDMLVPRKTESIEIKEGSLKLPHWANKLIPEGQAEVIFNDSGSVIVRRKV